MKYQILSQNNQNSVFTYLNDVLEYFKNSENASLGEWPTIEIGWEAFQKTQPFYKFVKQWFTKRNINIIQHNDTNRYLSTFILAAEFPPTLGYIRIVGELVNLQGWLSLYRAPEINLEEYVSNINLDGYTVAQRQSLRKDSEGYFALLNLIEILASIRFYLDSYDNLETICATISAKQGWDLDLVLRIANGYKDLLIPPQRSSDATPPPKFSYQLNQIAMESSLVVKHNLLKKISIPKPSSISLPRFSSGTLSILSDNQNVDIPEENQMVKLEEQEGFIDVECFFTKDFLPVKMRDLGLKNLQFIISVKDKDSRPQQLYLGHIRRQEDFLVFDHTDNEIVTNTRLYKKGQVLKIVPLTKELWVELDKSTDFKQQEQTRLLPIFQTIDTSASQITLGTVVLDFRTVPFSINLRVQIPWESTFNRSRRVYQYFYSPMMQIQLSGDFAELPNPTIKLVKLYRNIDREEFESPIQTRYEDGRITPVPLLPSPGQYRLTVQFGEDRPSSVTFNLLPIKNIELVEDKHIRMKLYAPIIDFQLQGEHPCTCKFQGDIVDIFCKEYGLQQIHAIYKYQHNSGKIIQSSLKFHFETIQEVVGHFSKIITPEMQSSLSIKTDLIPNSHLEFRRNSLRDASKLYRISVYMERGPGHQRLFPEQQVMYTDGSRPYSLVPLVTYVKKHQFSRLLLIVEYENTVIYRVLFTGQLRPILNLENEWKQGAYNHLTVLQLSSLEASKCSILENIPLNSLVYGMVENESGGFEYATYAVYLKGSSLPHNDAASKFISLCNDSMKPDEEKLTLLKTILSSPQDSFQLMDWLSKAQDWHFPHDIRVFARILDTYPIFVAWTELARNPNNREEIFACIDPHAKIMLKAERYFLPQIAKMTNNPRFSPELITIRDIEMLEELNLLPTDAGPYIKLFSFCTYPFVSGSKPVLSWLTLFWLREYSKKQNILDQFSSCLLIAKQINQPLVSTLAEEFILQMPIFSHDCSNEQDLCEIFRKEQIHYDNPPLTRIKELKPFLDALKTENFSIGLSKLISNVPLMYAEPYLKGFKHSTKWKCIIFLSLTAVCTQLNKQPFLNMLHELWSILRPGFGQYLK